MIDYFFNKNIKISCYRLSFITNKKIKLFIDNLKSIAGHNFILFLIPIILKNEIWFNKRFYVDKYNTNVLYTLIRLIKIKFLV